MRPSSERGAVKAAHRVCHPRVETLGLQPRRLRSRLFCTPRPLGTLKLLSCGICLTWGGERPPGSEATKDSESHTGGDFIGETEATGPARDNGPVLCPRLQVFCRECALLGWPIPIPTGWNHLGGGGGEMKTPASSSSLQLCAHRASTHTLFAQPSPPRPPSFQSYFPGLFLCPVRTAWPWTAVGLSPQP